MEGSGVSMTIIFFGTPEYVLPILISLHKKFVTGPGKSPIVAVVTQSPKPIGRKQLKTYSPVDKWAYEHKVPIYYDFNKPLPEADLGVCAAFGSIIPKSVIVKFKFGILNIHPSLLPKYRGASPIQAVIVAGDTQTGVSITKMDEKVDHGPIVSQFKEDVSPDDTNETLRERLFARSAQVLIDLIPYYLSGKVKPKEQNHTEAILTKTVTKEDGFINLTKDNPVKIEKMMRAYTPWPGVWTLVNKKRLKILKVHLENDKLILDEVQLEGKNPVSWKQFQEAYPGSNF